METTGDVGCGYALYIRLRNIKAKVVSFRDFLCSHESISALYHGYEQTDRLAGVAKAWDVLDYLRSDRNPFVPRTLPWKSKSKSRLCPNLSTVQHRVQTQPENI